MDLNRAKKAAHILNTIGELTKERKTFEMCTVLKGELHTEDGGAESVYWEHHTCNGRYIKHIIAGIDSEIAALRDELIKL